MNNKIYKTVFCAYCGKSWNKWMDVDEYRAVCNECENKGLRIF